MILTKRTEVAFSTHPASSGHLGAILGDGQVIGLARGWGGAKLYNPATNSWTTAPNLPAVNWGSF